MATVRLTCNLPTACHGAVLLCLPNGVLCNRGVTTILGLGGRLAAADFVVAAGATSDVPVGLTALGEQIASPPGADAGVLVDLLDYGTVLYNSLARGNFALTTTDPAAFPAGATTHCGGTVFAGPDTSCPFAENVANAYVNANGYGNTTVTAASPVNGQTYSMQCTGESPVTCTGGANALVEFYT